MTVILAWNLSRRDLRIFLTIMGSWICSPRLNVEFTMSLRLAWNSLNDVLIIIHPYFHKASSEPLEFGVFNIFCALLGILKNSPCFLCIVSGADLLDSSLVTTLNKAFSALLLKFAVLILVSSHDASGSLGLVQPTLTASQIFSSKDYKKALMRTFQYA